MDYKVDVLMMAYNHEQFIGQAIESILAQKTDFSFRLIIGEDFSPDITRQICQEYATKFPKQILLVERTKNVGPYQNFVEIYNLASAPYIALCEGDDYWTDKAKLQKQIDFLDKNEDFILCFHAVKEIRSNGAVLTSNVNQKKVTDVTNLISGWYMNTASYVFRNVKKIEFPSWFYKVKATDLCFHILIAEDGGKIYFIEEVMAVYRRHEGGITDDSKDYIYHLNKNIPFYQEMIGYLESKSSALVELAREKLNDIRNKLFYQLYYKKNKGLQDYFTIVQLALKLRKFKRLKKEES